MSLLEQKAFLSSIHPFESLSATQLDTFAENMDIVYFKENEIIQKQGKNPESLFFILKGLVQEKQEEEEDDSRGEAARVFQASVGRGAAGRIPLRVAQENFVARTDVRLQQFRVFLFERVRISKAETHSVQRCDAHGKSENGGYFQQRALYCAQRREERIFHEFYFPGKSVQVSRTAVENE